MLKISARFAILGTLLMNWGTAHAAVLGDLGVSAEPIIGFERVETVIPAPARMVNRITYGGRITAGFTLISGELEYTRGQFSESVGSNTYDTTGDRARLGLRSGVNIGPFLSASLRAGAQAGWETTRTTLGGVTTSSSRGPTYAPYGGAEARFKIGRNLGASIGVIAIFPDFTNFARTEFQTTAGFHIRFP